MDGGRWPLAPRLDAGYCHRHTLPNKEELGIPVRTGPPYIYVRRRDPGPAPTVGPLTSRPDRHSRARVAELTQARRLPHMHPTNFLQGQTFSSEVGEAA